MAEARSLFSEVIKSVRTPGTVVLEICRSSSMVLGKRPVMADAVTGMSPGAALGPVKA